MTDFLFKDVTFFYDFDMVKDAENFAMLASPLGRNLMNKACVSKYNLLSRVERSLCSNQGAPRVLRPRHEGTVLEQPNERESSPVQRRDE